MTDIAEHLPRYERKPRTDIASVNEAAAQQAVAVLQKWLGPGSARRGRYYGVNGWAEVETGRGGRNADADSYAWRGDWQDSSGWLPSWKLSAERSQAPAGDVPGRRWRGR
jgi:hypothetical protein